MSRGPVFILGDLRQPGQDYAERFLDAVHGFSEPVIVELFSPAPHDFLARVASALPNFTLEVSLESHDPVVRRAFGKAYDNGPMERTLADALDVGARRLDVFFMAGLPQQTADSGACHHRLLRAIARPVRQRWAAHTFHLAAGALPGPRQPRLRTTAATRLSLAGTHARGTQATSDCAQLEICAKL